MRSRSDVHDPMELRDDPNLILAYVEGELDGEAAARFEQRCAEDASLATLVGELQADRAALRGLPHAALGPGVSPSNAALAQLERQLLLGDGPTATNAGARYAEPSRAFRILRYATYAGLAAALGLTAAVVVNNLTGTPLEQRARELTARQTDADRTAAVALAEADAEAPEARASSDKPKTRPDRDLAMSSTDHTDATATDTAILGTLRETTEPEASPDTTSNSAMSVTDDARAVAVASREMRGDPASALPGEASAPSALPGMMPTTSNAVPPLALAREKQRESRNGRATSAVESPPVALFPSHTDADRLAVQEPSERLGAPTASRFARRLNTTAAPPNFPPFMPPPREEPSMPADAQRWLEAQYWLGPVWPSVQATPR